MKAGCVKIMRKSMTYLSFTLAILLCGLVRSFGQDTASWRLVANALPVVSGNISANNAGIGSALSINGAGNGYTPNGLGAKGWVQSATLSNTLQQDTTAYYEFAVRPRPGYSFMINGIRSTNKLDYFDTACANPSIPCGVRVVIRYAYDSANFSSTYSQPIYFVVYNTDSVKSEWLNLSIPVNSGRTLYFRMYAYKVQNNKTFYCKDFSIIGASAPCVSPDISNFVLASVASPCAGLDSATVTVNSTSLPAGTYIMTYSLSGSNSYSDLSARMIFAAGTGTFKIPAALLTNAGPTQLQITRVGNTGSCFSALSSGNSSIFSVLSGPPGMPGAISGQDSVCQNASGLAFQISPVQNAISYSWSVPAGWTINSGNGTTGISVTAGSGAQPGYVSVSAINSCGAGAPSAKSIFIKSLPGLSSATSISRCNNIQSTYSAQSNLSGTVFSWSRSAVSGISNPAASGSGAAITETLNNTTSNPLIVTYIIGMTNNGCTRSQEVSVTVNPSLLLSSSTAVSVCSGQPLSYTATSSTAGLNFSWSRASVSGLNNAAASGVGSSVSETLVNSTSAPVTANYTFTLSLDGCSNNQQVAATVNPVPVMTSQTLQTRCTNMAFTYNITASFLTGTTFSWYRNPVGTNSYFSGSGSSISETLINNTSSPINAVYVITLSNNGCQSTAFDTAVVNPGTSISIQPQSVTVCSDSAATFSVVASGINLAYLWQVSTNGGTSFSDVTSATGSVYSIPGITFSSNNYLYRVRVTGRCGMLFSSAATLTVPSPVINNVSGSQLICDNTSPAAFTGIPSGGNGTYAYLWERSVVSPSGGYSAASGINNQQTYSSAALSSSSGIYYFRRKVTSGSCAKNSNVIQITVTPGITGNIIASNQTICQNSVPALLSGSAPGGGNGAGSYMFRWERSVSGAGLNYDSIAATQSYVPGTMQQTAWFRRIVASGGCRDTSSVISIQVVATNASVVPDTVSICLGQIATLYSRGTTTINAQDFSDNARGWSQANVINSGGINSPNPVNNGSGNSNDWVRYSSGNSFIGNIYKSPDSSDFLMTQSNRLLETTTSALYSPALNTSGFANLYLKYVMNFRFISAPDAGVVEVSTDNINWTIVKTYAANIGDANMFVNEKVDLSAYVNRPALYIRLKYFGQYGGWWAIDNLIIEGISAGLSSNAWSPATYLFTDAAATTAYVPGTSLNTVYAKPPVETTYAVGASGCFSSNTGTVKVNPTSGTTSVAGSGTYCSSATISASSAVSGTMYFQGTSPTATSTSDPASSKTITSSGTYYFRALASSGCWTSADSAVVVINKPPSVIAQPASRLICVGGNDTLRVQASGTGLNYQWQVSADGGLSWANLSDDATYGGTSESALRVFNAPISSLSLSFKVTASSGVACGTPVTSNPVALRFRNVWTGINSSDWFQAGNWSENTMPDFSCSDIYIPGNRPFQPVLSASAAVMNINVLNGGLLTLSDGELKVAGTITSNGGIDAREGTIEFNGSGAAQSFYGSLFTGKRVKNLRVNNPAGLTLSNLIGDTLKLSGQLSFGNVNTVFNTSGNLYLLADSLGAASVADLSNGGVNNNSVSGEVTVETFINSGRKWRFLSIPAQTSQTFRQSWQEGNGVAGGNNRPGYGTIITDNNNATYLANGFDFYSPGGPGVKKYNVTTSSYSPIPSAFSVMNTSGGYMVYVRGDRSALPSNTQTSPTVLRVKGPLKQGNQNPVSVPANAFVDIGNPFASSISMNQIEKTGVQDVFYCWDPRLGGRYGLGGFQVFTNVGGRYYPTPGGGSYSDTAAYSIIQSGQAFFVRGSSSGGTVTIRESAKANGFRQVFRGQGPVQTLRLSLYEIVGGAPVLADGAAAEFDADFSNSVDDDDALKFQASGLSVSLRCDSLKLAVERRKTVNQNDTLRVNMSGAAANSSYRWLINVSNMDIPVQTAWLRDNYLNSMTLLNLGGVTSIDFSGDSVPASRAADRFLILFRQLKALPVNMVNVSAVRQDARSVKISWTSENEESIDYYVVQRGKDGRSFPDQVLQKQSSRGANSFSYSGEDSDASGECLFYRIKAVGMNGQVQYSTVVKVLPLVSSHTPPISVFPNPVKDHRANLYFGQHAAGNYHLALQAAGGQVVWKSVVAVSAGESQKSLKLPAGLAPGLYQLLVTEPGGILQGVRLLVE